MADFIGTGFPQFPCALVQMRYSIGENGCGHILIGGNSGGKEGRWLWRWGRKWRKWQGIRKGRRRKGERVGDMLKASYHTGGNTNKKIYMYCADYWPTIGPPILARSSAVSFNSANPTYILALVVLIRWYTRTPPLKSRRPWTKHFTL